MSKKRINPVAKMLRTGQYQPQTIGSKKKQVSKQKCRGKIRV